MKHSQVRLRSLEVTDREALALLAALELSPFEDEILGQKLLNAVYREDEAQRSHPLRARVPDFAHRRR